VLAEVRLDRNPFSKLAIAPLGKKQTVKGSLGSVDWRLASGPACATVNGFQSALGHPVDLVRTRNERDRIDHLCDKVIHCFSPIFLGC
jgi:hypothetical protein